MTKHPFSLTPHLLLILSIAFLISGCAEEKSTTRTVMTLEVSPNDITVANTNDTTHVSIVADGDWSVESDSDWLTLNPASGRSNATLDVIYSELQNQARVGQITISAPNHYPASATVLIHQSANPPLKVSPTSSIADYNELELTFTIEATSSWVIQESLEWMYFDPDTGTGTTDVVCRLGLNSGDSRTGVFAVSAPGHYPSSVTAQIQQNPEPAELKIIPPTRTVAYDLETTGFSIVSDGYWTVGDFSEWITVTPREGRGDSYIRVSMHVNNGPQREGLITINAPNHAPASFTIHVIQEAAPNARPPKVTGLVVEDKYWDAVDLKWSDDSETELLFRVDYKEVNDEGWTTIGETVQNATAYQITGLIPVTHYLFRVFGVNGFGISESSKEIGAMTDSDIVEIAIDSAPVGGLITAGSDRDWFSCTVPTDQFCTFEAILTSLSDSEMWLYGPDDRARERLFDDDSGTNGGSKIDAWLPAGKYFVKINAKNPNETGTYNFQFLSGE